MHVPIGSDACQHFLIDDNTRVLNERQHIRSVQHIFASMCNIVCNNSW